MGRKKLLSITILIVTALLVANAGLSVSQVVDMRTFSKDTGSQENGRNDVKYVVDPETNARYKLYPFVYETLPEDITSPFEDANGKQYIVACTKKGKFAIIDVTIGVKETQHGKFSIGDQLKVDDVDFPTLAATGLHSEEELNATSSITGKPVSQITTDGQPKHFSEAGFMAADENIINVLRGDNRIVGKMKSTHPEMAKPLFHMWNLILVEVNLERFGRFWNSFDRILYNGVEIEIKAWGTKGYQQSIFNDEIIGGYWMNLYRELSREEMTFLKEKYSWLGEKEFLRMVKALTFIHTGEMEPYYIQRYGFYEGHTEWRADPIAIAWLFGFKSLQELESIFDGKLYEVLTGHHN